MKRGEIFGWAVLWVLSMLASCGGSGSAGSGSIAISVQGAESFNPHIDHGRIEFFEVVIAGDGIDPPMKAAFSSDVASGVIEGVPSGEARTIAVTAINANGVVIRAGEAEGVSVGGGTSEVTIQMEAVPIITNIADGNILENTRCVLKIFSDPTNPIFVEDRGEYAVGLLADISTGRAELELDPSTGMGQLTPEMLLPGAYRFLVKDLVTGRSSETRVTLLDGTERMPAQIVTTAFASDAMELCSAPICDL